MNQNNIILCVSNSYEQKFYMNEEFATLPAAIKDEVKIMSVLFTEDVGGVLRLEFEDDGTLVFQVEANEDDLLFDEIGSVLLVKELQREKSELLEAIELYYKAFFLGDNIDAFLAED